VSRRDFLGSSALAAGLLIVPRHVLGGPGETPPSQKLGGALIGCGGRGPGTFGEMSRMHGRPKEVKAPISVEKLAECDVRFLDKADNKRYYTDFRRVVERKDIDVVAIGTPPHWHALIAIAAMEAGKDVLSEKPMTRFIAEGRAVVTAAHRYGRIFQVGTFGRYGDSQQKENIRRHKLFMSGLVKETDMVVIRRGGFKVKEWSGKVNLQPQPVPKNLDWDMYCGPSPLRPYHRHRTGGTHRGYWDYEGGGLADMGQHHLDALHWVYGRDTTSPVAVDVYAPPAHPECCGLWGWVELQYADGFTLVLESGEWGKPYDRKQQKGISVDSLDAEIKSKVAELPDPAPLVPFAEAVITRKQGEGNDPESFHRTVSVLHLANIAIRVGRKFRYDPVKEQIVGDDEANRLVNQPMRAPWHL
jgi:predicted dehydrogenase